MRTMSEDALRDARERLLARRAVLRDRLDRVRSDLRRDLDPLPLDAPDAAAARENDEVLQEIERATAAEISQIGAALARDEQGTLGLCETCGLEIDPARFVAVPYATKCRTCLGEG